jgi:hypothetical protein
MTSCARLTGRSPRSEASDRCARPASISARSGTPAMLLNGSSEGAKHKGWPHGSVRMVQPIGRAGCQSRSKNDNGRDAFLALAPSRGRPSPVTASHARSSPWRYVGTCGSVCPNERSIAPRRAGDRGRSRHDLLMGAAVLSGGHRGSEGPPAHRCRRIAPAASPRAGCQGTGSSPGPLTPASTGLDGRAPRRWAPTVIRNAN